MKLYYYKDPQGNFGDDLNAWLWQRLLPDVWGNDDVTLAGIGTIIGKSMPDSKRWIVFGSGTGYSGAPEGFGSARWNILAVRGPLTAQVLGLSPEKAVTDGAILLSLLPEYQPVPEAERKGVVFMPHHKAMSFGRWREVCRASGIEFIDPRADARQTLEKLRHAKLVLADAMHAAIVADTLRIPWIPLSVSSETNSFKWLDWTASMELPYKPVTLPASSLLEQLQSIANVIFGVGYALPAPSVESALRHYHEVLRRRENYRAPRLRFLIRNALKILKLITKLPFASYIYKKLEKRNFTEAVEAMLYVQRQASSLSDAAIFDARKTEMRTRLERLKELFAHG